MKVDRSLVEEVSELFDIPVDLLPEDLSEFMDLVLMTARTHLATVVALGERVGREAAVEEATRVLDGISRMENILMSLAMEDDSEKGPFSS